MWVYEVILFLLCGLLVLAWLIYNVVVVDRAERRETAKEMRQALKWADRRKMKQQADYKSVLRGK